MRPGASGPHQHQPALRPPLNPQRPRRIAPKLERRQVLLGHLMGLPPAPWEWERFVSNHAAYHRLRTTPLAGEHIMSLIEANGTAHLSKEYLTI